MKTMILNLKSACCSLNNNLIQGIYYKIKKEKVFMKKRILIIFLAFFIIPVTLWISCFIFDSHDAASLKELGVIDELDGSDLEKATPPVQPEIPWTPALTAFRDALDAAISRCTIVVTQVIGDQNANFKFTFYYAGVSGTQSDGTAVSGSFNVYADQTTVTVIKNSITIHYYIAGDAQGAMFYDGLAKYLQNKNGTVPKQENVIILMFNVYINHIYNEIEIVFRELNTVPYFIIYKTSSGTDCMSRADYTAKVNAYIAAIKSRVNSRYTIVNDASDPSDTLNRIKFVASAPAGYLKGAETYVYQGSPLSFMWVNMYDGKPDLGYYNPSAVYNEELRFHYQDIDPSPDGFMLYDGMVECLKYYYNVNTLAMSVEIPVLASQIRITAVNAATKSIYFTDPNGKKWVIVYISGETGLTVSELRADNS